jgi:hypothetical protein
VIVVCIVTEQWYLEEGYAGGAVAAGAVGGAAGSVAGQLTAMALGVQKDFSWRAVAAGALSGAATSWLGASGITEGSPVLNAMASNVINQTVNRALDLQQGFNWKSLGCSAISAYAAQSINSKLFSADGTFGKNGALSSWADTTFSATLARSTVGALVSATTRLAIQGGKLSWESVAADALSGSIQSLYGTKYGSTRNEFGRTTAQQADYDEALRDKANADTLNWTPADTATHQEVQARYAPPSNETSGDKAGANDGIDYTSDIKKRYDRGQINFHSDPFVDRGDLGETPDESSPGTPIVSRKYVDGNGQRVARVGAVFSPEEQADAVGTSAVPDGRARMHAFYQEAQDNAVAEGSFLKYLAATSGGFLGEIGYRAKDMAVAAVNDPINSSGGFVKSVINFGPDAFNGAVNGVKTSMDGWSLALEYAGVAPEGTFSGFRETSPYNITPLTQYNNDAQAGGGLIGNFFTGSILFKYGNYELRYQGIESSGLGRYQTGAVGRFELVANSAERGVVADANFAQPIIGREATNTGANYPFSPEGQQKYTAIAGRDIKYPADLTQALLDAEVHPGQIPVDYVILNGQKLILNSRTSTALRDAGIPQSDWYGMKQTGQIQIPATEVGPARTYDQAALSQLNNPVNAQFAIPGQVGWPQLLVPKVTK